MEFNAADTMVAGRTNCNRFFGKYELKGKELELKNLQSNKTNRIRASSRTSR
ncbi:META domain-containing protein [Alistipes putredinis]|uniref:META domain-containing protein n=1 Tax=Alistipes putredinis TaxID=28117 RepID=UPI003AB884AE